MSERGWVPRRFRGRDDAEHRGPFAGVPKWMFGPLWTWITEQMPIYPRMGGGLRYAAVGEYRRLAMALRISLDDPDDPDPTDARQLQTELLDLVRDDAEMMLDAVDFLVSGLDEDHPDQRLDVARLMGILDDAGSVWQVRRGEDSLELVRRVTEEERHQVDATIADSARAGRHLSSAWSAAYGREPDPTKAYREAVRAVEAAAGPHISPQSTLQTLGTMIRDMEAKPDKWSFLLGGADQEQAVLDVVGMTRLLWKGQHDRHGTADESAPIAVSIEEARAALQVAVPLVRWFTDGTISSR